MVFFIYYVSHLCVVLQHIFTEESWGIGYIKESPIWRSTWQYIHILTIIERIEHEWLWTTNSTKQVCIILYIMKLSALSLLSQLDSVYTTRHKTTTLFYQVYSDKNGTTTSHLLL